MKQKQALKNPIKPRNHHAYHPIMNKGAVHEKTYKAKRQKQRQQLKRQLNHETDRFFYASIFRLFNWFNKWMDALI